MLSEKQTKEEKTPEEQLQSNGWMGVQFNTTREKVEMNESVILDTGATFSSFANKDLVCNRQRQKNTDQNDDQCGKPGNQRSHQSTRV